MSAGTLVFTGTNNYSGITTISTGTLQIGAGGATGTLGTGNITNNAALVFIATMLIQSATLLVAPVHCHIRYRRLYYLSGANTYSGATSVTAGTLVATNATALGSTAGGTSVTSGATLEINGVTIAGAEAITINGAGVGSAGALTGTGTAGYAGLVTLGSSSTIGSNSGTFT